MGRFHNATPFLSILLWPGVVHAQELATPFGHDLWHTASRTWVVLILLMGFGVLVRVLVELRDGRVTFYPIRRFILDVAVYIGVGAISGFVAFALCESLSSVMWATTGVKMPDYIVSASITVAAFNKRLVLDAFAQRLKRNIDQGNSLSGR